MNFFETLKNILFGTKPKQQGAVAHNPWEKDAISTNRRLKRNRYMPPAQPQQLEKGGASNDLPFNLVAAPGRKRRGRIGRRRARAR